MVPSVAVWAFFCWRIVARRSGSRCLNLRNRTAPDFYGGEAYCMFESEIDAALKKITGKDLVGKEEWRAQVPDSDCLGIQSVFWSKAISVSWEAIFAPLSASTWELFKGCFWGLRASKTPTVSEAAKSVSADLGVCVRAACPPRGTRHQSKVCRKQWSWAANPFDVARGLPLSNYQATNSEFCVVAHLSIGRL